ncbi:TPA: hypothetical protein ACF3I9_004487 [Klebsiella aerogenes]
MKNIKAELASSIYIEPDDNKAVEQIIQRLEQENINDLPYVHKMKAEEMLLNIRYDQASIKAEHLYDNLEEIPAFLQSFGNDTIELSKLKMTTPEEYQNSLLRQKVEHNLTAMKQVHNYIGVDPEKDDTHLGAINDAIIASTDVLKRTYQEAYDNQNKEALAQAHQERLQREADFRQSILNADSVKDAMGTLEIYNDNYYGGELDLPDVFENIIADKEIHSPDIFDMDHRSQLYIELSAIYEAKRLIDNRAELITAISDLEGTLSALEISKEFGFDTEGMRKINDQLDISIPVLQEVSSYIEKHPGKTNLSENLISDVHTVLEKAKSVMGGDEPTTSPSTELTNKQHNKMR